ncbi:hypothetical protein OAM01_01865 [bacterium]|nr:hypothetical protein [bacterium]
MDQKLQRWKVSLRRVNCPQVVLDNVSENIRELKNHENVGVPTWKESLLTGTLVVGMLFLIFAQWQVDENPNSSASLTANAARNRSHHAALQAGYSLALLGDAFITAGRHTKLALSQQTDGPISQSIQTIQTLHYLIKIKPEHHE